MNERSNISALNYLSSRLENSKTDTAVFSGPIANYSITSSSATQSSLWGNRTWVSAQITDNVGNDGSDTVFGAIRLQFKDAIWDNINNKIIGKPSWQNTEPDYTKAYKPVVRGNGSINTQAFHILAKLNISQLKTCVNGWKLIRPKL